MGRRWIARAANQYNPALGREDVAVLAVRLLQALNVRIDLPWRRFFAGDALVWDLGSSNAQGLVGQLALAIDNKVVRTLRMTFVDQDDALAAILGVPDTATVKSDR